MEVYILCLLFVCLFSKTESYCWGTAPGFTGGPLVEQISLTTVRVSWRGLVTRAGCADQFVVKSWPKNNPNKLSYVLLPTDTYMFHVDKIKAEREWAFQVGGREDGGWLGTKLSKSPITYFTTINKTWQQKGLPEEFQEPNEELQPGAFSKFLKQVIFGSFIQYPVFPRIPDLSDPTKFGLTNTSHFFISSPMGTSESRIGVWYMLPQTSPGKMKPLTESDTVILYLHGNSDNRGHDHRVGLYKKLLNLGYYVLAVDYRGYGDSSPVILSEKTVVEDARAALAWIQQKNGFKTKVIVYGHSLGSSIASHMLAEFDMETRGNSSVDGLILEAPFNNMYDEVMTFAAAKAASWMVDIRQQLLASGCLFDSEHWLPTVKAPVLILHAEDDKTVPYSLGKKLYESALVAGKKNIEFLTFAKNLKLGHSDIYRAENIETELKKFIDTT